MFSYLCVNNLIFQFFIFSIRILELYAQESAIEDTMYYLSEALRCGVIESEVFLKVSLISKIWYCQTYCFIDIVVS